MADLRSNAPDQLDLSEYFLDFKMRWHKAEHGSGKIF